MPHAEAWATLECQKGQTLTLMQGFKLGNFQTPMYIESNACIGALLLQLVGPSRLKGTILSP